MRRKLLLYQITGILIFCLTMLGYAIVRTTPVEGFTIFLGIEGILLLFPVMVAELELYIGFKHILFNPYGKEYQSKTKILDKNVIYAFMLLASVLAVWLGTILHCEFDYAKLLPIVGGLIAMMAFRLFCSSVRVCLKPSPSKSQKQPGTTIKTIFKILGTAIYLLTSVVYTIVAILYAGLTGMLQI